MNLKWKVGDATITKITEIVYPDFSDVLPTATPEVVKKLTHDGARLFGMTDRGTLEPGAKADVNLIDLANLGVSHPEMIYDLPAGMPRLMQTATGYEKTFVSGEVVQENGKDTGARPGRIVRSR